MIKRLFCYGTLMEPAVFRQMAGCLPESTAAKLPGYRCYRVRNADYPGIRAGFEHDVVRGLLYQPVNSAQLRRLDRFEGEYYRRKLVKIECLDGQTCMAWAYVINPRFEFMLTNEPWSLKDYRASFLRRFGIRFC